MARKDTLVTQLLTSQSMAASFTSPVSVVRNLDNCSYQINFTTSDAVGSFVVEASDDYQLNQPGAQVVNAGNWIALDIGGTPTAASANDQILIDLNQLPFNAIRFRYVRTSGTGTLNAFISCKQAGG
jgi:hypothetical protein